MRAFGGFYDRDDPESSQDLVARLLFSSRGVILVISAQAAVIAGVLAYAGGSFSPLYFALTLVGFVTVHAASNLSNDYFGYLRGHDTPDSPRRRYTLHPLADGILTRDQMKLTIASLLALDVAIAAYLATVRGPLVVLFLALGVAMLFLYDAAPRPLKEVGLGELAAFLVWGPLMVFGGYFVISGRLSPSALVYGIPYGLGVMSILMGKHIDQEGYDRPRGINTLPVIAGEKLARRATMLSILLMYAVAFFPAAYGRVPLVGAVLLLNYGKASGALRALDSDRPEEPPKGYVGWPLWYHRKCLAHNRSFGWLYIAGLAALAVVSQVPSLSSLVLV